MPQCIRALDTLLTLPQDMIIAVSHHLDTVLSCLYKDYYLIDISIISGRTPFTTVPLQIVNTSIIFNNANLKTSRYYFGIILVCLQIMTIWVYFLNVFLMY